MDWIGKFFLNKMYFFDSYVFVNRPTYFPMVAVFLQLEIHLRSQAFS